MMVKFDVVFFAVFFQVRKCGDVPCKLGVCKVPQLDRDCFSKLYYLPDPQPDTNRPGHFLPFSKLKGQDTKEKYCPSLNSCGEKQTSGAPPGMLVGQRLRSTVNCDECHKPHGIYAQHVLSVKEKKELEVL